MMRHFALIAALCCSTAAGRQAVPEFEINLDLDPRVRFAPILSKFNSSVWDFYSSKFENDKILTDVLYELVDKRGPEPAELQAEVEGLAELSKLPVKFVQGVQMLYELQTLMVPIVNFTGKAVDSLPVGWEALSRIGWSGPGCTGIIARCADGTVYHARNLDFAPVPSFKPLVYTAIFTKGGKEVFRSQMVAGYQSLVTGLRAGPDGFSIERNTRYTSHEGGNEEMLKNLLGGRPVNGWSLRKIMEEHADYDSAIKAITTVPYASTEYAIVSGVQKGQIISRAPEETVHVQTLDAKNFEQRSDYIIITNFDFFWGDVRAYFDPTGGKIDRPRRIEAQKVLNATEVNHLTPEILFETINAPGVLADTIFQAVINVEKNLWNVSIPDLA